jgi:lipopolysaccharide transport system ATP-binding protein
MRDTIIKVDNISKAYRIGLKEKQHDTLGAAISMWVRSPFENYRRLRSLSRFDNGSDEDLFWALRNITFEVSRGEVLGIIGKNGAGKSTLLKILSRITEPTEGRAEIYGRIASLLEVGTGFNPELTGRENVFLNGTILGMTKKEIERKFDEIVDFSGVEKFIDTPVKRYSSGMKVRLAFAVAAHLDPEILIIDEVLAVGDAEFQKKCLGKMHDLSGEDGRTVLFVSHDMRAVSELCPNSILLNQGKIARFAKTMEVIDMYLNDSSLATTDFDILIENSTRELLITILSVKTYEFIEGRLFIKILDYNNIEIMLFEKVLSQNESLNKKFALDISSLNTGTFSIQAKVWATEINGKNIALVTSYSPFQIVDRDFGHKRVFAGELKELL